MKSIIVGFAFVACALAVHIPEQVMKQRTEKVITRCQQEHQLLPENLKKILHGDFSVRDEKTKCYMDCIFRKIGYFGDDGEIDVALTAGILYIEKDAEFDKLVNVITKCKDKKGTGKCDHAFNVYECFKKEIPQPEANPQVAWNF